MADGINKVILIGTLGFDPEHRMTASGQSVTTMRMVTNERYTDKATGERKEQSEWHRVVVWGKTADLVKQYLRKGRQCYVEGRIRSREWEKDGQKRTSVEIVAQRVVFLGGRAEGGAPAGEREERAPYRAGGEAAAPSQARDGSADSEPPPADAFKQFSDGIDDDEVPF
jgi:single-strand DNA-binding protein